MLKDSIATLAATPPPRKLITNFQAADRRIKELETFLSVPHSPAIYNVGKANGRIKELEVQLAHPARVAPPAGPVEIATTALAACAKAVFGTDAASTFEGQRLQFSRAGLSVPKLKPSAENYTPPSSALGAACRSARQEKINTFFTVKH
jgi:hypothetical protein